VQVVQVVQVVLDLHINTFLTALHLKSLFVKWQEFTAIDYLCLKESFMPKLYEYFGLIFLFYSQEHQPIHIHGKYQDKESKAEIIFENGKFKEIVIKDVPGKEPLDVRNLKKFRKIIELYRDDIVRKWIDFFVYNIEISPEVIRKRI
jgi:hypothetical protein